MLYLHCFLCSIETILFRGCTATCVYFFWCPFLCAAPLSTRFQRLVDSALEMPSDAVIDGGLVRGLTFLSAAARPHMLFLLPPNSFSKKFSYGHKFAQIMF